MPNVLINRKIVLLNTNIVTPFAFDAVRTNLTSTAQGVFTPTTSDGTTVKGLDRKRLPRGCSGAMWYKFVATGDYDSMLAVSLTNSQTSGTWVGTGFYVGVFVGGDANVYYTHSDTTTLIEAAVVGNWYGIFITGGGSSGNRSYIIKKSTDKRNWTTIVTPGENSNADLFAVMTMSGFTNKISYPEGYGFV